MTPIHPASTSCGTPRQQTASRVFYAPDNDPEVSSEPGSEERGEHPILWSPPSLPVNASHQELGRWGEELATAHLEARGYRIHARNWRCAQGELDIVASHNERLAAIEVKTRRCGGQVPSIEAITRRKLVRLRTLLAAWIREMNAHSPILAIDLIAIDVYQDELWRIHHIESIR